MKIQFVIKDHLIGVNNMYKQRGFQRYITPKGKAFKESVAWQAKAIGKKLEGKIEMSIDMYFPNNLRRDIDNWFKALLDSFTGILYDDDSQIVKLTATKQVDKENPRTEITLKEIERGDFI